MLSLRNAFFVNAVLLLAAGVFVGCSGQNASQPSTGPASSADWETGLDKDVVMALSQLSADDRTAALAQKDCPVTDKPLGSMGKPLKVTVEGQEVFLCCDGCEEELKKEPAKYLAKLNAN